MVRPRCVKPPTSCSARTRLLLACLGLIGAAATAPAPASAARGCAPHITTTTKADGTTTSETQTSEKGLTTEKPCWVEEPYPFVEEEEAGDGTTFLHYDIVTSLAFRAWNRGLALAPGNASEVWFFNGATWMPEPGFIGAGNCPGNTIVWAGKLDYWILGGAKLCRYDGIEHVWSQFELPPKISPAQSGGITSAACFAWNNCWFFGMGGLILHWNGESLANASPNPSLGLLQGEYLAAAARLGPGGERFGVAAGVASQPGRNEPQLYGSSGEAFSPLAFSAPVHPTDLVAVGLDSAGHGWVAGNPPGKRAVGGRKPQTNTEKPMPSPLVPISTSGSTACVGPPESRFTWTDNTTETEPAGAFLWASIGVIPSTDEALVGGRLRAVGDDYVHTQPVVASAACTGTTSVTQFLNNEDTGPAQPEESTVYALAANASNDAWAATRGINEPGKLPRLYRFTNGQTPDAPQGDDLESRPLRLKIDQPIYQLEPPEEPAAEVQPLPIVTQVPSTTLPPAIYDVKVKLHTTKRHGRRYFSLYLTFKVRRPIRLGAQALRRGRVVSVARAKQFTGQTGQLILNVERKRWPTSVRFIT